MNQIVHWLADTMRTLRSKAEHGITTIELVIWGGGLALLAVLVIAVINTIVNGWTAKIPT